MIAVGSLLSMGHTSQSYGQNTKPKCDHIGQNMGRVADQCKALTDESSEKFQERNPARQSKPKPEPTLCLLRACHGLRRQTRTPLYTRRSRWMRRTFNPNVPGDHPRTPHCRYKPQ